MAMNTVKNPTNYELGESRLTVLAEDKATGLVNIYTIPFTADPGIQFPMGTMRKNTREKTMQFNQDGSRGTYTFQKEPIEDRTLSLTYNDDAFYWGERVCINVDKSVLSAMFAGESFKDTNVVQKIVGTNGTRMINPVSTNNGFANLFLLDGKSALPNTDDGTGLPRLIDNDDISAYNRFGLTVMIEIMTDISTTSGAKSQGLRWVYCAPKMANLTQNEDVNKKVAEFDVFCDTLYIDSFFVDSISGGLSTGTEADVATSSISGLNVKAIISNATPSAPTFAGELDDLAVVIDTDSTFYIYKCTVAGVDGAATWTAFTNIATINYIKGCLVRGNKTGTGLATTATGGVGYVVIGTEGLAGSTAKATAVKYRTAGTGTDIYIYKVKDFDLVTGSFIEYTVE